MISKKATLKGLILKLVCGSTCLLGVQGVSFAADTWMGLVIAPENRCSEFDRAAHYSYPQSVEDDVVKRMGGVVYGPYTGTYFSSDRETDIEHIVSVSEAHDSGLCAASVNIRKKFSTDLLNLTLAAPSVNRCSRTGKCGKDAGEWMPERNECWFSYSVIKVKRKYKLTIDLKEYASLKSTLAQCDSYEMIFYAGGQKASKQASVRQQSSASALDLYDINGNGRITCAEAREKGIAPVKKDHIAYRFMYDADGDGVVCE